MLTAAGKGVNVAKALGRLGVESKNLTQLGGPRTGEFLSLCQREGVELKYAKTEAPIRTSFTIINKERAESTELVEETFDVPEALTDEIHALFKKEVDECSLVVISGSRPKGYRENIYSEMVRIAKAKGVPVILDIRGNDLKASLKYGPDIIKPNLSEFVSTFMEGVSVYENEESADLFGDVKALTAEIYKKYGTKTILTRGKYDTWVYDGEGVKTVKNIDVPVLNTIGCGDTFTAALASSLLKGEPLLDAVAFAMEKATERAQRLTL